MNAIDPTDLSDAEWECLQRHLPTKRPLGRPCGHPLRAILDAVFSLLRTGCAWRGRPLGSIPRDFPPWQTVYYHFRRFRLTGVWSGLLAALRTAERARVGKEAQPSAAIIDAQSVKTVEESARISGDDGHKRVKGRKRGRPLGSILVDTLGLPLSIEVTPAGVHDKVGAWRLLAGLTPLVPRLAKIWADGAYTSGKLARWCREYGGWDLEIVGRDPGPQGFAVQPRRWVVEPGALRAVFAWLVRNRRLRIDYERKVQTSETLIEVAVIRLLVRRLARAA
jgi:putative transposase